jgi:hypothetical protein
MSPSGASAAATTSFSASLSPVDNKIYEED